MTRLRCRMVFHGRVQGVGFRATTRRLAGGFQIAGSVRNLPDGGVEVVAEGTSDELDAFRAAIEREFAGSIRDREIHQSPVDPNDPAQLGFVIRY